MNRRIHSNNTPKGFSQPRPRLPGTPNTLEWDAQTNVNPERVAARMASRCNPPGGTPSGFARRFRCRPKGCPDRRSSRRCPAGQPWAALRNAFSVALRLAVSRLRAALQGAHFIRRSTFDVRCSTFVSSEATETVHPAPRAKFGFRISRFRIFSRELSTSAHQRQGSVLIVVIGLLLVMMLIGITFFTAREPGAFERRVLRRFGEGLCRRPRRRPALRLGPRTAHHRPARQ